MIYRKFQDLSISALGFGAMRLPVINGNDEKVDEKAVEEMVKIAMEGGVNYYDTAWGYHNGQSEAVVGKALKAYPRERFFLADKFPGYDLSNMSKVQEIFEQQLIKCGVEYFDFYFFHNVCELNIDAYLDPKFGIYDYLIEQKRNGRIRHLGFSAHGSVEVIERFLDAYGKDMEFCQLQLNYLDWHFQNTEGKVALLAKWGIPVIVMEPLRGGKLVSPPEDAADKLKAIRPDENLAALALRFTQSVPEVFVTLSGMSNTEQLRDNIKTFEQDKALTADEMATLLGIADEMTKLTSLPCTACRYCVPHCPQGLDIPKIIDLYNEHVFTGGGFLAPMALQSFDEDKRPGACLGCAACEAVCPQQIKISDMMADFVKRM